MNWRKCDSLVQLILKEQMLFQDREIEAYMRVHIMCVIICIRLFKALGTPGAQKPQQFPKAFPLLEPIRARAALCIQPHRLSIWDQYAWSVLVFGGFWGLIPKLPPLELEFHSNIAKFSKQKYKIVSYVCVSGKQYFFSVKVSHAIL